MSGNDIDKQRIVVEKREANIQKDIGTREIRKEIDISRKREIERQAENNKKKGMRRKRNQG